MHIWINQMNNNLWYNNAKKVKFIIVDYRFVFFLLLFIVHMRLITFFVVFCIFLFMLALEVKNISFGGFFLKVRYFFIPKFQKIK
jgi:hypothetical protein